MHSSYLWICNVFIVGVVVISGCVRVGIEIPKIEVRFNNLTVSADVQIGSRALPTLINYTRDAIEVNFVLIFSFFLFVF